MARPLNAPAKQLTEEQKNLQIMFNAIQEAEANSSGGGSKYLEASAKLKCKLGTSVCELAVTPHNSTPSGRDQANKDDCVVGTNILAPFFVICKKDNKPCMPDIVGKWNAAYGANIVGTAASITMDSFLVCSKGGIVYPVDSGLGMALANPSSDFYKMSEFYLMNAEYMAELNRLTDLAFVICHGNIAKTNELLLQYMRNGDYTTFTFNQFAGVINQKDVDELRKQFNRNGYFNATYKDIYGNKMDLRHLAQTLMTYQLLVSGGFAKASVKASVSENVIDNVGGWAGDFITGYLDYLIKFDYATAYGGYAAGYSKLPTRHPTVDDFIKSFYSNKLPSCSLGDMLQDIDAYCIYQYMEKSSNKDKLFNQIFAEYNSSEISHSLDEFLKQHTDAEWENEAKTSLQGNAAAILLGGPVSDPVMDQFSKKVVDVWKGLYEQNRKN